MIKFGRRPKKPPVLNTETPPFAGGGAHVLSLAEMERKTESPLNKPVWNSLLLVGAGSALLWMIRFFFGFHSVPVIWLAAFLACTVWIVVVRLLLLDSSLKKFWLIWVSGGFLLSLFAFKAGVWIAALSFNLVFLLFRRYRPYRHLSSRQRAVVFLAGCLIFSLLTFGFLLGKKENVIRSLTDEALIAETLNKPVENPAGLIRLGSGLARYGLDSLRLFLFFSLSNLFLFMRLHFMKLKAKLAVSALLITVVPLVLVVIMGFLTLYSTLGESRAARAVSVLRDWANLAAQNETFLSSISGQTFTARMESGEFVAQGAPPDWLNDFYARLISSPGGAPEFPSSDRASFVSHGSQIWLIHVSGLEAQAPEMRGGRLDRTMMNRLAAILHADIRLSFSNPIRIMGRDGDSVTTLSLDPEASSQEVILGTYLNPPPQDTSGGTPAPSLWKKKLYFGMTHLDVIAVGEKSLAEENYLILLEASIASIGQELLSERNPLSVLVMAGLFTMAFLMLILEGFALFFGLRITTGITSAVKALHQGTRRIATGDLDTPTHIANEDELGDLAHSFNVMAAAVKKGREEAVERERLERELRTARDIQERLLPHTMPDIPGFEICGTSLPSQQVGGDYFDFLDMGTGHLGIAIGDVSGKGIPAALLMANLQASLHGLAGRPDEVASIIARINNLLVRSTDSNMFATFFYGVLDKVKSEFTFCNAGHNPPLHFSRNGDFIRLEPGGLIIGFLPDQDYIQKTVSIEPGNVIIMYTDGITEAEAPRAGSERARLFGEERLIEVVRDSRMRTAREIQSEILRSISEYTDNAPQRDDVTLVVIKGSDPD